LLSGGGKEETRQFIESKGPRSEVIIVPTYKGDPFPVLDDPMDEEKWKRHLRFSDELEKRSDELMDVKGGIGGLIRKLQGMGCRPQNFGRLLIGWMSCGVDTIYLGGETCVPETAEYRLKRGLDALDRSHIKKLMQRREARNRVRGLKGKELIKATFNMALPMSGCVGNTFEMIWHYAGDQIDIILLEKTISWSILKEVNPRP